MAGAGFKTFNTGDVLTASDVNTYLMQQTVMVFADASARSTALGANVSEGMLSYLKSTDVVEVYNGSAWVSSDDPNAIQNSIVDAKGDLISATADNTPARLASSGVNGNVLTIDTSTSTGLKWAAPATGGKVLQVVSGTSTAQQDIKTAAATDITGMTVTLTPSANTSKVLITGALNSVYSLTATNQAFYLSLVNGANTELYAIWNLSAISSGTSVTNIPFTFLHSPSTTSSITYKLRVTNDTSAQGVRVNGYAAGTQPTCSIVAMEIGA